MAAEKLILRSIKLANEKNYQGATLALMGAIEKDPSLELNFL